MARIHPTTTIDKFTSIDDDVTIGEHNTIGSHVIIRNGSVIGDHNLISAGVQIGVDPQDYHYKGETTHCVIGNSNIIREYTTISKATGKGLRTIIGDDNFIMTYVHIAHNVVIGNHTVISSGSQLAGHVQVGSKATIGGLVGVHQFCRIGECAMLGAKSYLNQDLLPFLLAQGNRARVYGVNARGLQRHEFPAQAIDEIKTMFRIVYLSTHLFRESMEILRNKKELGRYRDVWVDFINASKRGILLRMGE